MAKEIKKVTNEYEKWIRTPEGMYFDEKEKELLISTLRLKIDEKVLEIGCGTGRYVSYLSELGLNMTGVEPLDELWRVADMRSDILNGQVIKASAEELPFEDETFDSVFFMTTFEYVDNKVKALEEAFRVSKNKIGIGFFNKQASTNIIRSVRRKGLFADAEFFTSFYLEKFVKNVFADIQDTIEIKINHSVYLPIKLAHFVPFVDDMLEKVNLPFGNFAVMVISKK